MRLRIQHKGLRLLLRGILITLGLGILFLLFLQWASASRISNLVIAEVNKQLSVDVQVRKVSFSLFRRFPRATVSLHDVFIPDAYNPSGPDTLFHCKTLLLQFRIFDILKPKKDITRIEIREGEINVRYFEDGTYNYDILKPTGNSSANPLLLELQTVVVKDTRFRLTFVDPPQDYQLNILSARLSGTLNGQLLELQAKGHGITERVDIEDLQFVTGAEVEIETQLKANLGTQLYELDVSSLLIDDQELSLKGRIDDSKQWLDIQIRGDELSVAKGIYYLPHSLQEDLPEFEFEAQYSATCSVVGSYARYRLPAVVADFNIEPGMLRKLGPMEDISTHAIRGSLYYMDPSMPSEIVLNVPQFEAFKGDDTLRGSFRVEGMESPSLSCDISGSVHPGEYLHLINSNPIDTMLGSVAFNARLRVPTIEADSLGKSFSKMKGEASFRLLGITFTPIESKFEVSNCNGNIYWVDGSIRQATISSTTPYGKINIKASLSNLSSLIVDPGAAVEGAFVITSPLLKYQSPSESDLTTNTLAIPSLEGFQLSVQLNVDSFIIDTYSGRNLQAALSLMGEELSFSDLKCKTFGGEITGRGNLMLSSENTSYAVELETKNIDIRRVFHAANNFDQTTLTEHNIAGRMYSEIRATGRLDSTWSVDLNSLIADAHVRIDNGRLFDFKPIESIAKYIRVDDLSRISFATLENDFQVREGEVIIPEMKIISTAVSMTISGVQKFDGEMDYHLVVALSEVLGSKAKRNPDNLANLELGDGGLDNIYLHLTGTPENPIVKYEKREVKSAITRNLKEQKNEVKSILHQEFGIFKNNPPPVKPKETEKKPKYTLEIPD